MNLRITFFRDMVGFRALSRTQLCYFIAMENDDRMEEKKRKEKKRKEKEGTDSVSLSQLHLVLLQTYGIITRAWAHKNISDFNVQANNGDLESVMSITISQQFLIVKGKVSGIVKELISNYCNDNFVAISYQFTIFVAIVLQK